jgi:lipopolysaccharide transport system ATP-binding protein
MQPTIQANHVSKRYRRAAHGAFTLRDELAAALAKGAERQLLQGYFEALDDVSFALEAGSICGLVGANGSGKTTLVKILSRITPPSTGEVRVRGRLASMLEVGASFDPHLNGIDNIYLNGAIMGMSRGDVRRRIDAIIDFADIAPVMTTQVKRYSSGMYSRLAFAIAAHMDFDILLLDEILSVGDHEFRLKCAAALRTMAREGRTIVLVSHDMDQITGLCDRALYMEDGRLAADGEPNALGRLYLERMQQKFDNGRTLDEIFKVDR